MIDALEQAVLARAAELVRPLMLKVEAFPEDPDLYHMTHQVGAVLVHYKGSSYAPSDVSGLAQERSCRYDLVVIVRNLRTHSGAYGVLDLLIPGFLGWNTPAAMRPARILRDSFMGRYESAWRYLVEVEIPTLAIAPADLPDEEELGILQTTFPFRED